MTRLVDIALQQRLPPPRRRSQWRRRLAKRLASPRTALWAAPALALPVLAMVLISKDWSWSPMSPIERTVAALPVVAGQSGPAGTPATAASPFGTGAGLPPSETGPLYNNSAAALAPRMQTTNGYEWDEPGSPMEHVDRRDYAEIHPRDRSKDDLLVGEVSGLLTTPLSMDLSLKIFLEYCNARPGDPSYDVDVLALPIERERLAAMEQLARLSRGGALCPRLADDY
jgi:hypothetical protein